MKAYQLVMAIVMFQFAIPIANVMGFHALSEDTDFNLLTDALNSPTGIITLGLPIMGAALASRFFGFHVPMGAAVFLAIFTVGSIPMLSTLTAIQNAHPAYFPEIAIPFIMSPIIIVIMYAFIQLSSQGGKGSY